LAKTGNPPSSTLVIFNAHLYPSFPLNPFLEPYRDNSLKDPRETLVPSGLDVVMVPAHLSHVFEYHMYSLNATSFGFLVDHEIGPWNNVVFSPLFRHYTWVFCYINVGVLMLTVFWFLKTKTLNDATLTIRNAVFAMGVLSIIMVLVNLYVAVGTLIGWLLQEASQYAAMLGLYTMAALWGTVGLRTEHSFRRRFYYFSLGFLAVLDTTNFVLRMVVGPEKRFMIVIHLLTKVILPAIEYFIAAIVILIPISLMQFTKLGFKPDPKSPTGWLLPAVVEQRQNLCYQLYALYSVLLLLFVLQIHRIKLLLTLSPLSMAFYVFFDRLLSTLRGGLLVAIDATVRVDRETKMQQQQQRTIEDLEREVLERWGNKLL